MVMGTGFGRTDSCSNPRNTLGRGMEPNHPELGLDPDVARRVNRVQTPKKKILGCTRPKETYQYSKIHYFMRRPTILCRNSLYHSDSHYIIQTRTISYRNSLYHLDTHYIMRKLTISLKDTLYQA